MVTVSVKELAGAIAEAEAFKMPDMNEGTAYLYDSIYNRLSRNIDVRLSDIDFGAFALEDVDNMRGLYSDVLAGNENKAEGITCFLRSLPPVAAAAFV